MKNLFKPVFIILSSLVLISCGSKGSNRLPNQANLTYSWSGSHIEPRGKVSPSTCGLTSKNCVCNLTALNDVCTLNFSINELNPIGHLQLNPPISANSAINLSISDGCKATDSNKIANCNYTFKWDKTKEVTENIVIQLGGNSGTQDLIKLKVVAK